MIRASQNYKYVTAAASHALDPIKPGRKSLMSTAWILESNLTVPKSVLTLIPFSRHKYLPPWELCPKCPPPPSSPDIPPMDSTSLLQYGLAVTLVIAIIIDRVRWPSKACPTLIVVVVVLTFHDQPFVQLNDIPSVGPSGHLLSYYGAAKFILHARSMVQQGYDLVSQPKIYRLVCSPGI